MPAFSVCLNNLPIAHSHFYLTAHVQGTKVYVVCSSSLPSVQSCGIDGQLSHSQLLHLSIHHSAGQIESSEHSE